MTESIASLKEQLIELHQRVDNAEIFQSLYQRVGELIEKVPSQKRTSYEPPADDRRYLKNEMSAIELQILEKEPLDQAQKNSLFYHLASVDRLAREGSRQAINDLLGHEMVSAEEIARWTDYILQDDILYAHVLEPKNQAVFMRASAVNMLHSFLMADRFGYFFLTEEKLQEVIDKVALLVLMEKDTRGFIGRRGWAHMFFELTNIFKEMTERTDLLRGDHIFMMTVLVERYRRLRTPLEMGEQNEIAEYLVSLLKRHRLYQDYFLMELKDWRAWLKQQSDVDNEGDWHLFFNYQRLMTALLVDKDLPPKVMTEIIEQEI